MRKLPTGYQWDPAQDARCHEKYGFGFEQVIKVFSDPDADYLVHGPRIYDTDEGPEERFWAIGRMEGGAVVAVVYTMRGSDKRLIWVRFTTREERTEFNRHNGIDQ